MSASSLSRPVSEQRIAAVRRFTRFYTRRMGVLRDGLLETRFSLTESRVLYELANRTAPCTNVRNHLIAVSE